LLQVSDDCGPAQFIVVSLVLIGLQTAVTGGFAIRVIQMLQCSLGNQVKFPGDACDIAAASDAGIHESQGNSLERARVVGFLPWAFGLKFNLATVEGQMVTDADAQCGPE
jgi:hypothetical protein